MSLKPYPRKPGAIDDHVADFAEQLLALPVLDGLLLTVDVTTTGSVVLYEHGLGRAYRGAILAGQSNDAAAVRTCTPEAVIDAGGDATKQVGLRSSAATQVKVWVF
jgi:hypothetical protein